MGYKLKNRNKIAACPVDFGVGSNCYFYGRECVYRNNRMDCATYQRNFITEEEKGKLKMENLEKVVIALGLRKLNRK